MKRLLSLITVLCLCLTLVAPAKVKAASLNLSKVNATMEVDSTLKLKLGDIAGNESTWISSNNKIVTVSKDGMITAKKEGTATITSKYNEKKYTCEVKVVNSNKKVKEYTLSAGTYVVGEDIDIHKYDITCVEGAGSMYVFENQDKVGVETIGTLTFCVEGGLLITTYPYLYTSTYTNFKPKKGVVFIIESGLTVYLKSK